MRAVLGRQRILEMRDLCRQVPVARPIQDYAVRLVEATHPARSTVPEVKKLVRYGSSPRGAQAVILAAKIRALSAGRFAPSFDDVRRVAAPALRHRVLLNFEGEAEGVSTDSILDTILAALPETPRTAHRRGPRPGAPVSARFDERFLRKLEYLTVVTKRALMGQVRAERRSRRVGAGIEFADHRDYVAGDDLRSIDWNLYGRMQRLLVRLFEEDEDLSIDVLFDASASMGFGAPPKLDLAMQVGAALAYVGLANLDRVAIAPIADGFGDGLPPARGKAHILPMLRFLDGLEAGGRTSLARAVRAFLARRRHRRGSSS